jgi:hypothetical protein
VLDPAHEQGSVASREVGAAGPDGKVHGELGQHGGHVRSERRLIDRLHRHDSLHGHRSDGSLHLQLLLHTLTGLVLQLLELHLLGRQAALGALTVHLGHIAVRHLGAT